MKRACEAEIQIAATPESVWSVVSEVTRVGEWSGECRGCSWVEGFDAAAAGARFRGHNRRGGYRWTRLNEILAANPPAELVWRTVPTGPFPDSVEWHISVLPLQQGGVLVRESFRITKMPRLMEGLLWFAMPGHRDRTEDLAEDLARLKKVVEGAAG